MEMYVKRHGPAIYRVERWTVYQTNRGDWLSGEPFFIHDYLSELRKETMVRHQSLKDAKRWACQEVKNNPTAATVDVNHAVSAWHDELRARGDTQKTVTERCFPWILNRAFVAENGLVFRVTSFSFYYVNSLAFYVTNAATGNAFNVPPEFVGFQGLNHTLCPYRC